MCIPSRIKKYIAEKEALDARIAQLEKLEAATASVKNLLTELLADYAQEAPEELPGIWEEILAIGAAHNLAVQPLAVDELRQWESVQAENEKLRAELEEVQAEITEQDRAWGELSDKCDDLEVELAKMRSQLLTPTIRAEDNLATHNDAIEIELSEAQTEITEPEHEPEEAMETVESILTSHGFFMPDINLGDCYDPKQKYEDYRGWAIHYSQPDQEGPVDGIGLYCEAFGFWDASTEMIGEDDPSFPQCFTDYDEIVAWTRKVIDQVVVATPVESSEVPGQLALEFPNSEAVLTGEGYHAAVEEEIPEPTELQKLLQGTKNYVFQKLGARVRIDSEFIENNHGEEPEVVEEALFTVTDLNGGKVQHYYRSAEDLTQSKPIAGWNPLGNLLNTAENYAKKWVKEQSLDTKATKLETETNFKAMGFEVMVHPQYASENLVGATFRFFAPESETTVIFAKSLLAAEIGDRTWKICAWDLIQDYRDKEAARIKQIANPYAKEEDKFLVKLTPAVGYLQRRDSGELLSAYAAFANCDPTGKKTATFAKPRAKKWAEHLQGALDWKVEDPRKIKRMVAELGAKQQFAYEVKITGKFSIGQLQKLAEEDFSLLPNEIAPKSAEPVIASAPIYRVKVNSFEIASGTEVEMRSRFDEELKTLGAEGRTDIRLVCGNQVIEDYRLTDFTFVPAQDFDEENPEFWTIHTLTKTNFRIYRSLESGLEWINSIYPYRPNLFATREAAAVDAVRRHRQLKAESAE